MLAVPYQQDAEGLDEACGPVADRSFVCEQVYDWTDSDFLASGSNWLLQPIRILFIVLLAWIASRLLRRAVARLVDSIANEPSDERLRALRNKAGHLLDDRGGAERAKARAATIGLVLRSIVAVVVWSIAALLILGELGVDLAPLIAGAGIAGVALGFGAQSIVKDFLSGLFMLIEDQYGVGDIVDVGEATGTVEKVSLRSTSLRDVQGTVWHVPNGEILRVGNFSQLWSRALIDIEVAYESDLRFAQGVIQRVADDLWEDTEWGGQELMERPEVWGVENLGASGVALRLVVKTRPSEQWRVERELRLRIKEALDQAGIEIPYPQQTVWFRHQGEYPIAEAPDRTAIEVHEVAVATDDEEPAAGSEGEGDGGDGGGSGDR